MARILVADDDVDIRELVEFKLSTLGHDVVAVSDGAAAIDAMLQSGQTFDAVFAANDMMANGALQALHRAGVRVPDEVAVVGFDDIPLARHIGLTTVQVRIAELGERAMCRLISVLKGEAEPGGQELHRPELVIRSTTNPKVTRL